MYGKCDNIHDPGGCNGSTGQNETCNSGESGEQIQVGAGSVRIVGAGRVEQRSPHIRLRAPFTDKNSNPLRKSQDSKTWIKLNPWNQRGAAYDLTPNTEGSLRATVHAAF